MYIILLYGTVFSEKVYVYVNTYLRIYIPNIFTFDGQIIQDHVEAKITMVKL